MNQQLEIVLLFHLHSEQSIFILENGNKTSKLNVSNNHI